MFKLICSKVQELKFSDGSVRYRVWFDLPDGSFGWLYSTKKYLPGDEVPLRIVAQQTQDTKTNFRLGISVG